MGLVISLGGRLGAVGDQTLVLVLADSARQIKHDTNFEAVLIHMSCLSSPVERLSYDNIYRPQILRRYRGLVIVRQHHDYDDGYEEKRQQQCS